jgi:hypothetical protein
MRIVIALVEVVIIHGLPMDVRGYLLLIHLFEQGTLTCK